MDHIRGSESAEGSIHGACLAFRFANFVRSHAEIKALISWQPAAAPNWHRRRRRRRRTFVRSFVRLLARSLARPTAYRCDRRKREPGIRRIILIHNYVIILLITTPCVCQIIPPLNVSNERRDARSQGRRNFEGRIYVYAGLYIIDQKFSKEMNVEDNSFVLLAKSLKSFFC